MRTALTLVVCCVLTPGCGPDIYIEPGPTADGPCQSTCELDLGIGTAMCGQPFTIAENSAPMMIGSVDMNGFSELEMRVDLCDPKGWTVHISDAITDGWGGDSGASSNDGEIHLTETSLYTYRSDICNEDPALFQEVPNFVSAKGCSSRTIVVRDSEFMSVNPALEMKYPCLLRINPPKDYEGTPDAVWYWGFNRTFANAERMGTGVIRASMCLR